MKIQLKDGLRKKLSGLVEGYQFEVGILEDKDHYLPEYNSINEPPKLKNFAGGPTRKQSKEKSGKKISEVFIENQKRINTNFLTEPLKNQNSDILKFTTAFLRMVTDKGMSMRRVENLLQAVFRNPILQLKYGGNKASTADAKGFDRHLFDTGQMFKAVIVKARRKK